MKMKILIRQYLHKVSVHKRSFRRDMEISAHIEDGFGELEAHEVLGQHVRDYINGRRGRGVKDSTIRRELALPSAAINYARQNWDMDIPNAFEGRLPAQNSPLTSPYTEDEQRRLLLACQQPLRDIFTVALATGCRMQEVIKLTWDRIDMREGTIVFHSADQKNKRNEQYTAVTDEGLAVLRRQPERDGCPWVFAELVDGEWRAFRYDRVKTQYQRARRRSGVMKPFKSCRVTHATDLLEAGAHIEDISAQLRHGDIKVTQRYAQKGKRGALRAVRSLSGGDRG